MKFELITALIAATSVTTVAAQEEEILYGERHLSRLDRRIKENGKSSKNELPGNTDNSSKSDKSDNSSKSSKSASYTSTYLLPFGCPKKCVDGAYAPDSAKLEEAIQDCDLNDETQEWKIHYNDEIMKFEGYPKNEKDYCIGVDSACDETSLRLVKCIEPESEWYFTGGQLISVYCWSRGLGSKVLSVDDKCEELELSVDVDPTTMFMLLGKETIASIPAPSAAPSVSTAPSLSTAPTS